MTKSQLIQSITGAITTPGALKFIQSLSLPALIDLWELTQLTEVAS